MNNIWKCFWIYKWSKWQEFKMGVAEFVHGGGETHVSLQKRTCSRCGKIEYHTEYS